MRVFNSADVARVWPSPDDHVDKYGRGVVGIDTGSKRYPGAGVLSVLGALNSGAGFIRFVGPKMVCRTLLAVAPSVTHGTGRVDVWLAGSGWDETEANEARLVKLLGDDVPMVLDAGAFWVMPEKLPAGSLLTPHAGELARLLGVTREQVENDPVELALEAARRWDACVIIKGHEQYVVSPSGKVLQAVVGPVWTAQAGSGDVMAGIAASLMAQGVEAVHAGVLAASVQAITAERHPGPYPPNVLAGFLPGVVASLARQ